MVLPDVSVGQGHVDAHNAERHKINELDTTTSGLVTTTSDLQTAVDALEAGSGPSVPLFLPETYGAVGYPTDDTAAIQAAIDAANAAGGGIVLLSKLYGMGAGDITQKNGVTVQGVGVSGGLATPVGLKAITGATTARYRFGNFTGHPYPGTLKDLCIDGNNIAGVGSELLRCEAVETSLYDVHVMNSVGDGVNLASSQNLNLFNPNFGSCPNGVALLFTSDTSASQPCGHIITYGGHIGDSLVALKVTSPDGTYFIGPHDNYFYGTIFETGRIVGQPITAVALLEDGDTTFDGCVFTIGAQKTAITADASIVVRNDLHTSFSTTAIFHNCDIGGGVGALKATDAVRIEAPAGHAFNQVHYSGRTGIAGVTYMHCHDGGDALVSQDGVIVPVTALTSQFRAINGGTIVGVLNNTQVPRRFKIGASVGPPIQIGRDNEGNFNRYTADRDGKHTWFDGASAIIRGTIQRATSNIMALGGIWQTLNGWGRFYASSSISGASAVAIDAAATSYHFLSFTVNGASVSALTITNGYEGAELRIGIFGTGVNAITWPGTGAGGIVPLRTLPQPLNGLTQFIDLTYIAGKWYEVNRSVRRGDKIINAQVGTSYQVVLTDSEPDAFLTFSNGSPIVLTIPTNATTAFPIGSVIEGMNIGAGDITITPAGGVTISGDPGLKVTGQPAAFGLIKTATDVWQAYGKLSA